MYACIYIYFHVICDSTNSYEIIKFVFMVHNILAMQLALTRQNESAVLYQIPQDVMWK